MKFYFKGSILKTCSPFTAKFQLATNSSLWISIHASTNFSLLPGSVPYII